MDDVITISVSSVETDNQTPPQSKIPPRGPGKIWTSSTPLISIALCWVAPLAKLGDAVRPHAYQAFEFRPKSRHFAVIFTMDHVICRHFGPIMLYFTVIYRRHADFAKHLPATETSRRKWCPATRVSLESDTVQIGPRAPFPPGALA